MRLRSLAAATALAVAATPFVAGSAISANTVVGQTSTPDQSCGGGPFTVFQITSGAPSHTVPAPGVITSVSFSGPASTTSVRAFKLGRAASSTTTTVVGGTAPVIVPAGGTHTESVRIPARAGDFLGTWVGDGTACVTLGSASDVVQIILSNPDPGTTATTVGGDSPYRLPVSAVLEPDADGDGFGDTTQDQCATDATIQGTCPVAKDTTAPETTITKITAGKAKAKTVKPGKKKKFRKAHVTVAFTANEPATFSCSIDGRAYMACANPLTVKLKKGTHTIAVKATDTAGNTDATPATTTVKIKPKKHKQK